MAVAISNYCTFNLNSPNCQVLFFEQYRLLRLFGDGLRELDSHAAQDLLHRDCGEEWIRSKSCVRFSPRQVGFYSHSRVKEMAFQDFELLGHPESGCRCRAART